MAEPGPAPEVIFPLHGKRIWVAGHRGMVGSALVRRLAREGCEIITVSRDDLDLKQQSQVASWLARIRPDAIFLAAATVGGIVDNAARPADFLYDNLMIEANVVDGAYRAGVEKLMLLGSSCIYPKFAPQPIRESALLSGQLEPTNEAYAIAKIAGIKLGQAYRTQYGFDVISAMPANLSGPGDNFDLETSHVLPALIRKAHEAKLTGAAAMTIWGTGEPRREFLHSDDCADALVLLMKACSEGEHVNVGSGGDVTIRQLAELVAECVGFRGGIICDTRRPDGTPRKLMSVEKLQAYGWSPRISLGAGIADAYAWFLRSSDARSSA